MIRGKKYIDGDAQVSVFPMEVCTITQGIMNAFSHRGLYAWDLAGRDANRCELFAPFDCEIVWKKPNRTRTGIVFTNTTKVLTPRGEFAPRMLNVLLWHDNDTSDLWTGKFIQQGEKLYDEGIAGNATGNHIHLMVGIGLYDGSYPLFRTRFLTWAVKNQVDPIGIFFNNDTVMRNGRGYHWQTWTEVKKADDLKVIDFAQIKKGDMVKVVGTHWATGQKVPLWVKAKKWEVLQVGNGRALLKGVLSWAHVRDLRK